MTKHFSLAGLLLVISFHLLSQPDLTNFSVSPENEVGVFEKIELRFRLNLYDNNYDSDVIRVDAEFISPSGKTYTVPGFYYVDYIKMPDFNCGLDIACESLKTAPYQPYNWVVRFTPNETGKWTYSVTAKDKRGTSVYPQHTKGSFICHNSEHTGFITKNNNRYLKKGDKPYWKKRAYKNALNYKPNVVVIMLGTNDSKPINWKQKQDFVSDYVELVKSFQKLDSKPEVWVCLPVPAFPGKWGINEKTIGGEMMTMVKEVAKRTGAKIIDLHAALKTHGKLFPDTVHPNAEGAGLMAKAIAAEIARKK